MLTLAISLMFSASTKEFGLPPHLLESVCYIESHYDVNAVHKDDGNSDSLGVCQVKFSTAQWLGFKGTAEELMNPAINIHYAAKVLAHQYRRYNGSTIKSVIAYNQGSARTLTRTKYSDKVIKTWEVRSGIRSD